MKYLLFPLLIIMLSSCVPLGKKFKTYYQDCLDALPPDRTAPLKEEKTVKFEKWSVDSYYSEFHNSYSYFLSLSAEEKNDLGKLPAVYYRCDDDFPVSYLYFNPDQALSSKPEWNSLMKRYDRNAFVQLKYDKNLPIRQEIQLREKINSVIFKKLLSPDLTGKISVSEKLQIRYQPLLGSMQTASFNLRGFDKAFIEFKKLCPCGE